METKHLETFVAVMETGSLSAAARRLGRGQPQLSQWMAELEADTGLELFQRTGNRAIPTEQAKQWLPWARQAWQQLQAIQRRTQALAAQQLWTLSIGVEECIPASMLTPALIEWQHQWPQRQLDVCQYSHRALVEALQQQQLQLAVAFEHQDHIHQISYQRVGRIDEGYIASPAWLQSLSPMPNEAELCQQRELVWVSHATELDQPDEGMNDNAWLLDDLALVKQLLLNGQGYAVLPLQAVQQEIEQHSLQVFYPSFEPDSITRRLQLLWPTGFEDYAEMASLLRCVRSCMPGRD